MLQWGFYAWCWKAGGQISSKLGYGSEYEITQSLFFVAVMVLLSSIPTIPMSVYQHFVLEGMRKDC